MTNNFHKFDDIELSKGEFIYVQIIQRSKDGGGNKENKLIKYFCIDNLHQLKELEDIIIQLCESNNARAYLHYTPRNYRDVHLEMIGNLVERLKNNQSDQGLKKSFISACGKCYVKNKKTWVIDVDGGDELLKKVIHKVQKITEVRGTLNSTILKIIKTKNGYHLITKPFNSDEFKRFYPDIEIHKNNPTILYVK